MRRLALTVTNMRPVYDYTAQQRVPFDAPPQAMLPGFYFSNLEKAKRVAFAMEYLKDNCAKKPDTGF